ncbi:vesicle-associated membrane protein 2-like [Apteryx rowi]|uniref:vesicle-associated membrane protein 2-like n=1 Tax=Apteryx rowi TaxID=308060 RepID=UPI000E1E1BA8|nr:vesicle-associated membrane protein 2-like [Apteryx rowi]
MGDGKSLSHAGDLPPSGPAARRALQLLALSRKAVSDELLSSCQESTTPETRASGMQTVHSTRGALRYACTSKQHDTLSLDKVLLVSMAKRSAPAPTQGPTGAGAAGLPPATSVSSNKRLQQTQAQVDEVVDIMRMNVDKVLERDQKLSELDNRADALQAGASQFETSAAKLKRKYWWKNCKMMIILGVVCAVILIIIISE